MAAAPDDDVRLRWLSVRAEQARSSDPAAAVDGLAEALSLATADAVTVRRLADDGRSLVPVAVHHPDPVLRAAMHEVTAETAETRESGLWRVMIDQDRTVVFPTPPQAPPAAASSAQRAFLGRWPVRAVAGSPVRLDGALVGGVALVRFVADRPFSEADVVLLERFAGWVAAPLAALLRS